MKLKSQLKERGAPGFITDDAIGEESLQMERIDEIEHSDSEHKVIQRKDN